MGPAGGHPTPEDIMQDHDIDPPRAPFSLDQLLALAGDGEFLGELTDDHRALLSDLRAAAEIDGKAKGGFTLTVAYTVDRRGTVEMTAEAKMKRPGARRHKALAWVTSDGIAAENPKQSKFEFAAAPTRRELRSVTVD